MSTHGKSGYKLYLLCLLMSIGVVLGSCNKESNINPPLPPSGPTTLDFHVIDDVINDVPVIVVGSSGRNLVTAFKNELDGVQLSFSSLISEFPVVMEDNLGNRWNIQGEAIEGPDAGRQLESVNSGMGFWFVFGAMFPGVEIHGLGGLDGEFLMDTTSLWSVPLSTVAQGSGFDLITALESPEFIPYGADASGPHSSFYVEEDDLVIVAKINGVTRVYPHAILNYHEIINDVIGGQPVAITYCPLTGTAKVWERDGAERTFSFGVTGLLYNSNILSFDRETESYWSQLNAKCVNGPRKGETRKIYPHIETYWKTWLLVDSHADIMTENTGQDRDYTQYPYGGYRENDNVSYPLFLDDLRLPKKQRVFSVIVDGEAKVYQLKDFLQ